MEQDLVALMAYAMAWSPRGEGVSTSDTITLPMSPGTPGIDMSISASNYWSMDQSEGESAAQ